MTKWEYLVEEGQLNLTDAELVAELNEAGADGWELIGIMGYQRVFKRPREATTAELAAMMECACRA
jgi:hypothetical protein